MTENYEEHYVIGFKDTCNYAGPEFITLSELRRPISRITIGNPDGGCVVVEVDRKFNWFQKKMLKWCFGFEVEENK